MRPILIILGVTGCSQRRYGHLTVRSTAMEAQRTRVSSDAKEQLPVVSAKPIPAMMIQQPTLPDDRLSHVSSDLLFPGTVWASTSEIVNEVQFESQGIAVAPLDRTDQDRTQSASLVWMVIVIAFLVLLGLSIKWILALFLLLIIVAFVWAIAANF